MKVPSEKILKPGAKLDVVVIDWNDPDNKKLIANVKRRKKKRRVLYSEVLRRQITI